MKFEEVNLIEVINLHNKIQNETAGLDKKWKKITEKSKEKFSQKNILSKIKQFRKEKFLIHDLYPTTSYSNLNFITFKTIFENFSYSEILKFVKERFPSSIMQRKLQREIVQNLEKLGCKELLENFDISKTPGSPYYYKYKNYKFNMRWLRYIYFIKLYEMYIKKKLSTQDKLTFIDIGGGYAAFSELLKRKQPNSTNIIIDFPNQLSLAYYYLNSFEKNYIVGTIRDVKRNIIDDDFIKNYDFFLLPTSYFDQLQLKKIDLLTNFFSFGEMKEGELQKYLNSDIYKTAKTIFLSNRVFSNPNKELYEKDIYDDENSPYYDCCTTIYDYALHAHNKIFFDKNPVYPYLIRNKKIFFYEKINTTSDIFDFIGEKK